MFATGKTVGLAERIIDDTCRVIILSDKLAISLPIKFFRIAINHFPFLCHEASLIH